MNGLDWIKSAERSAHNGPFLKWTVRVLSVALIVAAVGTLWMRFPASVIGLFLLFGAWQVLGSLLTELIRVSVPQTPSAQLTLKVFLFLLAFVIMAIALLYYSH